MAFILFGPRLGWRVDTVLSGSMEPAFGAGDAVIIRDVGATDVKVGDVITYRSPGNESVIVSHRVVEVHPAPRLAFTTKGDANEEVDNYRVPAGSLTGRVVLSVPFFGYFANFAKDKLGLLLLLIVPGSLIIVIEMRRIWKALSAIEQDRQQSRPSPEG